MIPKEHVFQRKTSECGPCCVSMVHALRGKPRSVEQILISLGFPSDAQSHWTTIGQLASYLLDAGFAPSVILGNSRIVVPGWISLPPVELVSRIQQWIDLHPGDYWAREAAAIIPFLLKGGRIERAIIDSQLILERLRTGSLLVPCLDEVWLWGHRYHDGKLDEVQGKTDGHFVVLLRALDQNVEILDPYPTNLPERHGNYSLPARDIVPAILSWDGMIIEIPSHVS